MLTIDNLYKIHHKRLGKRNFYVSEMKVVDLDWYLIEITNRKMVVKVHLNRKVNAIGYYELICQYTGKGTTMNKAQVANIDVLLDKIRYVGIK